MYKIYLNWLILISTTLLLGCDSLFEEKGKSYNLSVSALPTLGGTVNPQKGSFREGTVVTLTATPSNGWRFVRWEGDWSSTQNPSEITLLKDYSLIGVFEKRTYPLNITIEGQGTVQERIVSPKTTDYPFHTVVELTPVPASGWEFDSWGGDLNGNHKPQTITISKSMNVVARFKSISHHWVSVKKQSEFPRTLSGFANYGFDKKGRKIYILNVQSKYLYSFDIDTYEFKLIPVTGYPAFDREGSWIFNPSRGTIQFWRSGRDKVYEVSKEGGNVTQIGNGFSDGSLYGSNPIFNGYTSNPAIMNGYGFYSVNNVAFELISGNWVQKRPNSAMQPYKRTTVMIPNGDFTRSYIIDGQGNISGSQFSKSCEIPGGFDWANDVGNYCWIRDIWEVNLTDWSVKNLMPINSNFPSVSGTVGYNYESNEFYHLGGYVPNSRYGETVQWNNNLNTFNPSKGQKWNQVVQTGEIPPIRTYDRFFYYDDKLDRFILIGTDGVWKLEIPKMD
jgi:frataxin-like iron-binding protein CyaY